MGLRTSDTPPAPDAPDSQLETILGDGDTPPAAHEDPGAPLGEPTHIGRFVVLRRVGEGGMGVVYAAYDNDLERRVAVKLVRLGRVGANVGNRIRREAQALARLSHPNVVQVYEVGSHEGQLFVAMEFITGPTLAEWAEALPASPQRWREVLRVYLEVGQGLAAAHAARIVHRDFKPANAIVGEDGRVRVLDFGIARATGISDSERSGPLSSRAGSSTGSRLALADAPSESSQPRESSERSEHSHEPLALDETLAHDDDSLVEVDSLSAPLTMTGALMGTPAYMSPEQFERRAIGAASDQFSFCIALWEALYGERPYAGRNPAALMMAVLGEERQPPPRGVEVPSWVHEVLARGLARDPQARWSSMDELLAALRSDPARRRQRRRRQLALVGLITAVIAGSGWFARRQQQRAAAAAAERAVAMRQKQRAERAEAEAARERDNALLAAQAAAVRARDTARILAAREFDDRPELAAALLRDVAAPEQQPGWRAAAVELLQRPISKHVFSGHETRVADLDVSSTGEWIASAAFGPAARLWHRDGRESFTLPHPELTLALAFSPDGLRLATACSDGVVRVWSVPPARGPAGEPLPTLELPGHAPSSAIWSVRFSHAGDKLVSAARDAKIRVHDLDHPERSRDLSLGHEIHWWAEFSPDDRHVLAAAGSGLAGVWSLEQAERPPLMLSSGRKRVGDAHFDPRGGLLLTASDDGRGRLYSFDPAAEGTLEPYALLEHQGDIVRAHFDPSGLRVLTVSRDGSAKVWPLEDSGELRGPPQVLDAGVTVWSGAFSPDGRYVALGLGGGELSLWPLEGGPPLALTGHMSDVFRVRFAPDSSRIYSAGHDASVRAWDMQLAKVARELPDHGGTVYSTASSDKLLAVGGDQGKVRLWSIIDPGTAPAVTRPPSRLSTGRGHTTVALDPEGRLLAAGDDAGPAISLWRIAGDRVLDPDQPWLRLQLPDGGGVRWLNIDPAGELLLAASHQGHIYLWRLREPSAPPLLLTSHPVDRPSNTRALFSPDGEWIATGGADMRVRAWSTPQLRDPELREAPLPELEGAHGNRLFDLEFAPDSARFVSVSNDLSARVWELSDPTREPLVFTHTNLVVRGTFHPSEPLLATACGDTNAYLWRLDAPEREPRVFEGAAGETRDVAFSPDGQLLATASLDGHVRVWPLAGGEPLEFDAHQGLSELHFMDRGRRIAAAGVGDSAWLWYLGDVLDPDALRARLRDATALCLSPKQRERLAGEPPEDAARNAAACLAHISGH